MIKHSIHIMHLPSRSKRRLHYLTSKNCKMFTKAIKPKLIKILPKYFVGLHKCINVRNVPRLIKIRKHGCHCVVEQTRNDFHVIVIIEFSKMNDRLKKPLI